MAAIVNLYQQMLTGIRCMHTYYSKVLAVQVLQKNQNSMHVRVGSLFTA